jgi:6-pyruvoyltetrahydropterin/6-carboxytetrahydropterin synthase
MYVRVTKKFKFEMAHALIGHDGPCRNIHGHSYQLSVTLKGKPITNKKDPKLGMVIDFADLKVLVNKEIVQPFDHALVLNRNAPANLQRSLKHQKLILVDFQPTCENMVIHFAEKLKGTLPRSLELNHLLLKETSTSFAEWYSEDNL